MSNKEQFEREFESFLNEEDSRIAALYRKLPRAEPDAKLDAAVLAMARRSAATTPRTRARAPRWVPALSAAAVVALAAGIAFRIGPTVWQEHVVPSAQKPEARNAPAPAPAAANIEATQPVETDALKDKAAPQNATAPAATSNAVPAAPAAAPAEHETLSQLRKLEPSARRVDAPKPQAFPKRAAVEQEKKPAALGAGAGASAPMQQAGAFGDLDGQTRDRKRDETAQTIPERPAENVREEKSATPMPTQAAPAPPPPPAREQPAPLSAPGDAPESAAAAPAAKTLQTAPRSKDANARLYPEHWLANIRVMLRENRHDDALRSLAEFRRMYPEYHLPDDLRDLK
jgi:hypothetical protein